MTKGQYEPAPSPEHALAPVSGPGSWLATALCAYAQASLNLSLGLGLRRASSLVRRASVPSAAPRPEALHRQTKTV
eukprot:15448949-Alexandrium_andersonii.AAC.1